MGQRQKILIVDDKQENLFALRNVLSDLDVEIIEATGGNEALAATLDHRFSVAILDVMMPGIDGYELAEYLKGDRKTRNLPIIFVTAVYSEEERIFKGYEAGAVDYIVKPYNPAVLLSKVRVFLELDEIRTELSEKILALTATEERFRTLVMTIPDIVYRIDTEGRFTYLNEAVQILGYNQEDLIGAHFTKILHPEDIENVTREAVLPRYANTTAKPEGSPKLFDERRTGPRITKALEVRLIPKRHGKPVRAELRSIGEEVIIGEINSSGIYGQIGAGGDKSLLLGSVGVIRDINERKRAEEELTKYRENLEIMVRERTAKLQDEIVERKRAEAALAERESYFRGMMYSLYEDIVVIDAEHRIVDVNNTFVRNYGRSREEIVGQPCYEVLHRYREPCLNHGLVCFLEEVFATGEPRSCLHDHQRADGTLAHVEISLSPLRDASGKITHVVEAAHDVTRLIEAQVEAEQAHERLSVAIRSGKVGVWDWDITADSVSYSPEWKAQLGYTEDELPNAFAEFEHRLHPEDRKSTLESFQSLKSGKMDEYTSEFRLRHKDGFYRWIYCRAQWTSDGSGKTRRITGCHIDVTDKKEEEKQREKLQGQLVEAQKLESIGRLAGGIAHDFNNLLTVIQSYTDMVLESIPAEDPNREDMLEVQNAGKRAAALTRQLLAFSRKQVFQPVLLDLNKVVENIEKMLRRILGEDIKLDKALDADLGVVMADPGQIEQVIMNLAVNARDAMPEGGKLTIETANVELDAKYVSRHMNVEEGSYVMLAVTDSGCGMDALTRSSIFEPFFTTKPKGRGTGLGLSTVYGIVKQSGGDIWVYSEMGKGTTFKIYLPRENGAAESTEQKHTTSTPAIGNETILVVEDDSSVRKLTEIILTGGGYTVLTAATGAKALKTCQDYQGEIDLVLTDVVMPEMSGHTMVERLLTDRPEIKVLYMSGYTDNAIVHHGVLEAGTNFIGKPYTVEDLMRKVRQVLDEGNADRPQENRRIVRDPVEVNDPVLIEEKFRALTPEVKNSLRNTAIAARYDKMSELVDRIRPTNPEVAEAILQLLNEFDYDGILELLDE